ncbi:MAG: 23S rRNA (adenine(2503)-C(2))-methyltransferase RlmN, partial [Planctomycetaceae bacterium]
MKNLLDMTIDELSAGLEETGHPAFCAKQIATWVYRKGVYDFDKMTDLSAGLRAVLRDKLAILTAKVVTRSDTGDGVTKLLLEFPDAQRVETVLIPADGRATACVSTQVGCAVGCTFCASGADGFKRNLTSGEIVEQILQLQLAAGTKITHVVFMGMGEPLA